MRTKLAAAAVVVSMLGGAGVGVALSTPSIATAADTTTQAQTDSGSSTGQAQSESATPPQWMTDALKQLVDAGTINQSQADAVATALHDARPDRGPGGPGGHGRHGAKGAALSVAATAIGISEDELRTELQSGKSIAEVAEAHGVDVQKVIDALVADKEAKLAQAVADGRLTQAQADEKKENIVERTTEMVNGTFRGRHGPPPADATPGAPADAPASASADA